MLADDGLLTSDTAATARRMAGFRNVLVHGYADVDDDLVVEMVLNRLNDLEQLQAELDALPLSHWTSPHSAAGGALPPARGAGDIRSARWSRGSARHVAQLVQGALERPPRRSLARHRSDVGGELAQTLAQTDLAGMVAGADCINDMDLLRHGGMGRLFNGGPSWVGKCRKNVMCDTPAAVSVAEDRHPHVEQREHARL